MGSSSECTTFIEKEVGGGEVLRNFKVKDSFSRGDRYTSSLSDRTRNSGDSGDLLDQDGETWTHDVDWTLDRKLRPY